MADDITSTPSPAATAEQPPQTAEETTKPPEPTISEKLSEKLTSQAISFNKLRGITEASFHVEKAIEWLTKDAQFEATHSDVLSLNAVMLDLGTYV